MKTGQIKGVYSSNPDGEEYITKNGNPFVKVCVVVDDKAYYDAFFFTPKAHWKFESLFKACGETVPDYEDMTTGSLDSLIGNYVLVRVGKDKAGYDNINLYKRVAETEPPVEQNYSEEDEDEDLDDVPF